MDCKSNLFATHKNKWSSFIKPPVDLIYYFFVWQYLSRVLDWDQVSKHFLQTCEETSHWLKLPKYTKQSKNGKKMATGVKWIVLSPIIVSGRFIKRTQDFLAIVQRFYIVQQSFSLDKIVSKDRGLCSPYFSENGCFASVRTAGSRGSNDC